MDYASARDLFDAARDAAMECERTRQMLLRMEHAAEGIGGASFEPRVRTTSEPDRMGSRVAAMIDREDAWRARIEEDERVMAFACRVLYGADEVGGGGVDTLLGSAYADVLWWRYLAAEQWDEVARLMAFSVRHVIDLAGTALDFVDANGIANTIAGERTI